VIFLIWADNSFSLFFLKKSFVDFFEIFLNSLNDTRISFFEDFLFLNDVSDVVNLIDWDVRDVRLKTIRFDSISVRFLPHRFQTDKKSNRSRFDSIRFDFWSIRNRKNSTHKEYKKLLIWSFRCVANKYIYMHLAYATCAHAKKNFFFVEFIELIRSISNQFEFCKSDENWAQLLALKLHTFEAIRNLMFLMFPLASKLKK
jgi:hypothetical protein